MGRQRFVGFSAVASFSLTLFSCSYKRWSILWISIHFACADDSVIIAKSYVANNDKPNADDPPLSSHIESLDSLDPAVSGNTALQIEELIRTFGALGQCM